MSKKDYKEIDIYYIGYVTVKKVANCNNINSVKHDWSLWRKKSENKYLVLDDVNENKDFLQKYE